MSSKPLASAASSLALPPRLPHQVLEVQGRDAGAFLQAQLMNDVRLLEDGDWQWSGWLSAKGRVVALLLLLRLEPERYWLVLPDAEAGALADALRRYVFRSRLTLAARTDLAARGLDGAPSRWGRRATAARAERDAEAWWLDLSGETGRSLVLGPADAVAPEAAQLDASAWRVEDLAHGLPRLAPDQVEQFTPQMLGLERLRAYSVKKGCYPGQEIVARTHFLGQAKRALQRLSSPCPLGTGDALVEPGGGSAKILCEARAGRRHEALAVLPLDAPADWRSAATGDAIRVIPFAEGLAR